MLLYIFIGPLEQEAPEDVLNLEMPDQDPHSGDPRANQSSDRSIRGKTTDELSTSGPAPADEIMQTSQPAEDLNQGKLLKSSQPASAESTRSQANDIEPQDRQHCSEMLPAEGQNMVATGMFDYPAPQPVGYRYPPNYWGSFPQQQPFPPPYAVAMHHHGYTISHGHSWPGHQAAWSGHGWGMMEANSGQWYGNVGGWPPHMWSSGGMASPLLMQQYSSMPSQRPGSSANNAFAPSPDSAFRTKQMTSRADEVSFDA